jgi:hypothetical protein
MWLIIAINFEEGLTLSHTWVGHPNLDLDEVCTKMTEEIGSEADEIFLIQDTQIVHHYAAERGWKSKA